MKTEIKLREIFGIIIGIILLIAWQWRLWITKDLMITHDSLLWYGIFSYFTDCLHNGFLPLWNPYMNSGEAFFLNIPILRLWDPSTLFLVLIGKFLKINLLTLYHYDLLLRFLIFICGCYFFFRNIAKYRISAFITFIVISFSLLSVSYLRQHAFILYIYLLPLILLSIFRFLEQKKALYLIGGAALFGIILPSHNSMFTLTFIFILLLSLFLTKSFPLSKLRLFLGNYKISLLAIFIFSFFGLMIIPLGVMFKYDIIPVVRIFAARLPAYSLPADFLGLLVPYYFPCHFLHGLLVDITPLEMSESFLYIGLLPLLLSIVGLFFSRHRYKFGFIITTLIIALLMLGDKTPAYNLFIKYFPFFHVIRNMHSFGPFFLFCLFYFVCIGSDVVYENFFVSKREHLESFLKFTFLFLVLAISLCIILLTYHQYKLIPAILSGIKTYGDRAPLLTDKLRFIRYGGPIRSSVNLLFFSLSAGILFFIFKKQKINFKSKYILLISFILIDLLSFDHTLFRYTTYQRAKDNFGLPRSATGFVYQDLRVPKMLTRLPFTAFHPVIFKQFTSSCESLVKAADFSEKTHYYDFLRSPLIAGTHFFETKDYYKFHASPIPDDIKDVWAGISSSKLRLVSKCVVASSDYILGASTKIDVETAQDIVFIEQDLPKRYSYLNTTLEHINRENLDLGEIEVKDFNPNEIVLDVYAKQDCFLFYSDGYDKSWRVFIDGKENILYKANLAFKAVVVPQGKHKVHFLYDPKLYKFGLLCYFIGLVSIAIVFIIIIGMYFKRKK